jgi:exonuclease III
MSVEQKLDLTISAINVNSMNVSTIGNRNAKTYLKVEGITGKKADVIFISDIRASNKGKDITKLMGLTRNGSYKLYLNSTRESRGVGIAIRRNISHEIKNRYDGSGDENLLMLDIIIKNKRITLGVVYGPNENNRHFYRDIENKVRQWGNYCIIGGDFNTIIDNSIGNDNLDREGAGRVPNRQNSKIINDWIEQRFLIDPFRTLYSEIKEMSYIPFRSMINARDNVLTAGKSRLDFFLISEGLLDSVDKVRYEDRLGSDFDHREVVIKLGRSRIGSKITIHDSSLQDETAEDMVCLTVYENLVNNLVTLDENIRENLVQLNILIREKETLGRQVRVDGGNIETRRNLETNQTNIGVIKDRLPDINELMGRAFTCNYRTLYEGVIMGVKNVLMEIQRRRRVDDNIVRDKLLLNEDRMRTVFGVNSQQWFDAKESILRFDDVKLKERATKFREFLDANNEKATKAFCRLSKEGGVCDDISQIKDNNGATFQTDKDRGQHIAKFYSDIYKKQLDNLMEIEEFLGREHGETDWLQGRKLSEDEKTDLEGVVTMEEVKRALDGSNFESSSGWDGVTFKALRKFWGILSMPMLKMIQETFTDGELMETFKMGLIKLIPKKGNANKVGDWRPITLLCCGYKIISGIVSNRLGKYLPKIIGRSQKGFMANKNINTCTVNVINSIGRAWELGKPTGIMCVDFAKAFDSVEHSMIQNVMRFFGFGNIMIGMVMTLLNDRKARIILESGYSEDIKIGRGTPQGDRSSPYIFILCIEILLIKINLMDGRGVDDSGLYVGIADVSHEKPTSEAYADDLTLIFKMNNRNVSLIIEMLRSFGQVSGLKINVNKTQLMVVGSNNWVSGEEVHGIKVVESVTILGGYDRPNVG